MTETSGIQPGEQGGDQNVGVDEDALDEAVTGRGASHETGTPPIAGGGEPGQTQTPAADDDVGVPEEIEDRTE